jgi:hypothetical protein
LPGRDFFNSPLNLNASIKKRWSIDSNSNRRNRSPQTSTEKEYKMNHGDWRSKD